MPEPKTVHDCVVNKVYDRVTTDIYNSDKPVYEFPTDEEAFIYKSIIRHTLNMALEICK
jgi:hypothetical protein